VEALFSLFLPAPIPSSSGMFFYGIISAGSVLFPAFLYIDK